MHPPWNIKADLEIKLNNSYTFTLKSQPQEGEVNVLTLEIPSLLAGAALMRQILSCKNLTRRVFRLQSGLDTIQTRIDVLFINHHIASVGTGGKSNWFDTLRDTFTVN